jgi:putative ABC transport system permease protein
VQLFIQFIAETVLLFALATIAALFAVYVLMPLFNTISAKQMVFNLYDPQLWLLIGLVITGTLIASSIYPALLLSSFKPLQALKGKISMGISDAAFRKVLVVTQFAFSVILIMGTIVITNQLNYIKSKSLGYDKNHVFAFWMRDIGNHYYAVKAELLKQPGVLNVTRSNQNIINIGGFTGNTDWDGKQPGQTFIVHPIIIDKNFMSFFKMKLLQGRSFTGSAADSSHYILNEAAIKELGLTDPVGKRFKMGDINGTIIGVVKNFHYTSMKEKIAPSVFWYNPNNYSTIYIKTTGKNAVQAIAAAQEQFKRYNGLYPFSYAFLDEVFNSMYQSEEREGTLFRYFALVAIFISCLGLLGLATYTAQTRTKEIGIRKVMGASVSIIVGMLSKDFIKLVIIAIVIATPLAWFVMQKWLQNYAYRQDIQWWVMVLAAAISLFIAFATISFQSIKAALANPVKSLRSE